MKRKAIMDKDIVTILLEYIHNEELQDLRLVSKTWDKVVKFITLQRISKYPINKTALVLQTLDFLTRNACDKCKELKGHMNVFYERCHMCDREIKICRECYSKSLCSNVESELLCPGCSHNLTKCDICRFYYCPTCVGECDICRTEYCKIHVQHCPHCEKKICEICVTRHLYATTFSVSPPP